MPPHRRCLSRSPASTSMAVKRAGVHRSRCRRRRRAVDEALRRLLDGGIELSSRIAGPSAWRLTSTPRSNGSSAAGAWRCGAGRDVAHPGDMSARLSTGPLSAQASDFTRKGSMAPSMMVCAFDARSRRRMLEAEIDEPAATARHARPAPCPTRPHRAWRAGRAHSSARSPAGTACRTDRAAPGDVRPQRRRCTASPSRRGAQRRPTG